MKKYISIIILSILFVGLLVYLKDLSYRQILKQAENIPEVNFEKETTLQTYRNEKYGFEFQHPTQLKFHEEINKNYLLSLKGENISDDELYSFMSVSINIDTKNNYKEFKENSNLIIDSVSSLQYDFTNDQTPSKRVIVIKNNNQYVHISFSWPSGGQHEKIFSQILSSFRFLDENNCVEKEICTDGIDPKTGKMAGGCRKTQYCNGIEMKYSCPTSEWIDCMPGSGTVKSQCQPEYLKWAQENCPNFKGGAL